MKKSFTLLEVIISITLFMILIVFLYKTLDQTKYSNNQFSKKEQSLKLTNDLYDIFLKDVAQAKDIKIELNKEKNSIVKLISTNTYHNAFFNNITYLIGSNNKLVRIESKDIFKGFETPFEFYDDSFIDILLDDIEFFEVKEDKGSYLFAIKQKNKERVLLNTYKLEAGL
jgi:type II secretory pathway pseudopilin PulG